MYLIICDCTFRDPKLLKNFECPVCMEYFQRPISQCPTGHSICSKCKVKLDKCPYCALEFLNTRNFALENMLSTLSAQCTNMNCSKAIPLDEYSEHVQQKCLYRYVKCKYPTCTWKEHVMFVNDHINTVHKSVLVQNCTKLISHQYSNAFIYHDGIIYFVHRSLTEDKFLIWTAEPTIQIPNNNMFLVVKITSATGSCHKLKQPVSAYMDNPNDVKNMSVIGMLKSKTTGCTFQLSIEK